MLEPASPISQIRWLPCVNGAGEEIPAFGLVRVSSVDSSGVLTVAKPNADSQRVLVNGPSPIPTGGYGLVTYEDPVHALYEVGDGTPAIGDSWGAGNASWKLQLGNTGWTPLGGNTDGRTVVVRDHASGASSTVIQAVASPKLFNAGDAIPNSTETILEWDSGTSGYFDGGDPDLLTAIEDGFWLGEFRVDVRETGSGVLHARLLTLPTADLVGRYNTMPLSSLFNASGHFGGCTVFNTFERSGSDVSLRAYVQQNSGGSLDVYAWLRMSRIGDV